MRPRRPKRAAVLLLVLWAIAVLALLAGGLSFVLKQHLAVANISRERVVAHCLARAGVERAIAALMDDTDATDTSADAWYDNPTALRDVALVGGTFSVLSGTDIAAQPVRYGVVDECAKLNINVATRAQLMKLPHMTPAIAGALLDWRDTNEEPELDGVERAYYAGLRHPFDIRNGPFESVRELLLVRGVTPELLFGEDTNGNGVLDGNEDDGDRNAPPDNADGRLDAGWVAHVTVCSYEENMSGRGQKRLNLNRASAGELSARLMIEDWAAQSIVKAREQGEFKHLADLLDVQRDPATARDPRSDHYMRSPEEQDKPVTTGIFEEIVDELTLSDRETEVGRVNLNTATRTVLGTLPEVDGELADAIVRQREALNGFSSIGQLLRIRSLTKDKFAALEGQVTVRSDVFRIYSYGHPDSGLATATIECVVDRRGDQPRVLYWLETAP